MTEVRQYEQRVNEKRDFPAESRVEVKGLI